MINDQDHNSNPNLPTLRQVRERLNMTQEEFARELRTTPRTIGRHERGEHKLRLTLGQIKRLKELLEQAGMSINDLPDDID
ncbi:MAG TPA: XRE family transcriptional regulator [Cyanobacteria bacterium UBA8553]|nr:XRE family transcriptional regulator [Cyanobacteria bacterium UBA8553]